MERDRCRTEGIDAYVARPVDLGHLCEIVEQLTRTGLPAGVEAEELYPGGEDLPARRRKSAADRDRIALQFDVDTSTGEVLGGLMPCGPRFPPSRLDAGLLASMDVWLPERCERRTRRAETPG
jgi:hypothetical protein